VAVGRRAGTYRRLAQDIGRYVLLIVAAVVALAPILWMLSSSLKPDEDLFKTPVRWIPDHVTLEHYRAILQADWFPVYLWNSVRTTVAATLVALVVSALAGYSLSRFRYRGHSAVMIGLLSSQMFPQVMLATPLFIAFGSVALLNTWYGLVLAYLSIVLPFCVWMMKAYFDTVPVELEEAAMIDGTSRAGALVRVVLPVALPGLVAVGLFSALVAWNEYLFTITLVDDDSARTLAGGIAYRFTGAYKNDWGGIMAIATLMSAPIVALFLGLQRYFIQGLTAGAVKG
jgi:multiple sugar transport system permease protein